MSKNDNIANVYASKDRKIHALQAEVDRLREALIGVRYKDCFCEVSIDNPNYRGHHSIGCVRAKAALKESTND